MKDDNSDQLDQLDGQSQDLSSQHLEVIKAQIPSAFDLDGNLVWDKLRALLAPESHESTDDIPSFGLGWPGKQRSFAAAGMPTTATLRPCPDQSIDFDTTQNLLIEGDNLEVLKTLQRSYHGKVKMIYIDPPYNTGKDFVYPDNYGEGLDTYLQRTQQKDEDGFWKTTNNETSGRKHANWLSMMAPRLVLARNLLSDDGVIFISIDDNEVANLRILCEEVFGAENFVANVVWQKKYAPQNDATYFSDMHDHILVFAKQTKGGKNDPTGWSLDLLPRTQEQNSRYLNRDNDPRGPWKASDLSVKTYSQKYDYEITTPSGSVVSPPSGGCWRYSKEKLQSAIQDNRIWFGEDGSNTPSIKRFLSEVQDGRVPVTWWGYQDCGHNQEGKQETNRLMVGAEGTFDTPKPKRLLERILELSTIKDKQNALVLDFFAGSGTTGHAVMAQNAEDGGNRKYICVQLPEPLDEPVTLDDGVVCETIFDLTRERLKRAGQKIKEEAGLNAENLDTGLRVFKLDSSNFTAWNSDPTTSETDLLDRLDQLTDQTLPGRSETDILWEILLKMGLPLGLQLERFEVAGASFIGIGDRTKVISTETEIPTAAMEALLDQEVPPSELVVLDGAFEDDTARANIATMYKQRKDDDGKPICSLRVV